MKNICGVDISKARLDACIEPGSIRGSFANDPAGIAGLAAFCRQHRVELVAMEATGGYERRAFLLLWEAGMPCAMTNPRSVRRYIIPPRLATLGRSLAQSSACWIAKMEV